MQAQPGEGVLQARKGSTIAALLAQQAPPEKVADFLIVFAALQTAVKKIAHLLSRAGIEDLFGEAEAAAGSADRDKAKKLDIVANEVMKIALEGTGRVSLMASEEDDDPVSVQSACQRSGNSYVAVFDPLDGSRNIDASIPTGTIFGLYRSDKGGDPSDALQPGNKLIAAAYALYSSATMLVVSWGSGVHGFTLDTTLGDFVLTHPDIKIPQRGQIYSVNDARYFDWPEGLRRYIDDIRQGKGQNPKQYSARYICSLVADFHRTLLYGGVAMNPRSHLRLIYEANPLGFLAEQAGGKASDGKRRILDIQPEKLHQRLPLFLGSPDDIMELESYGDVQQIHNPGYTV
ncbi:Fructose-1,6-bisphosphatase, chloroplastic [Coccomyxa sp. Obi]|nr:Fructose-1,6-bisphosphatase, chloroplastic [Coccomyxa sp. Obi]